MPANQEPNPTQQPDGPTAPELSPISWLGGMWYDQEKNQNALTFFETLGRTAVSALVDRDSRRAPKGFRVVYATGSTRTMPRAAAYLRTTDPEMVLIASRQEEARADELIAHIEAEDKGPVTHFSQSADAQNAVLAAHKRPDLFKNVILLFPTGMIRKKYRTEYLREIGHRLRGKDKEPPEVANPAENDFEASLRPTTLRKKVQAARRFKKSGGYAVAASGIAATNNYLLHDMRRQETAPGFSMVLGRRDRIGNPVRFLESLVSDDDVDYILITNTGHGTKGRKDLAKELLDLEARMNARNSERQAAHRQGNVFKPGPLRDRLLFLPGGP